MAQGREGSAQRELVGPAAHAHGEAAAGKLRRRLIVGSDFWAPVRARAAHTLAAELTAAARRLRSSLLAAIAASGLWLFQSGSTLSHAAQVVVEDAAAAGRPGQGGLARG